MSTKTRILFICTHNAARSQMAEGFVNNILGEKYEAASAGTKPSLVHPIAVKVMAELGIDISNQKAKHLSEFKGQDFDIVITLCSEAEEICPFFPGKEHIHQGFQDPAGFDGNYDEALVMFRRIRDEIRSWIEAKFKG